MRDGQRSVVSPRGAESQVPCAAQINGTRRAQARSLYSEPSLRDRHYPSAMVGVSSRGPRAEAAHPRSRGDRDTASTVRPRLATKRSLADPNKRLANAPSMNTSRTKPGHRLVSAQTALELKKPRGQHRPAACHSPRGVTHKLPQEVCQRYRRKPRGWPVPVAACRAPMAAHRTGSLPEWSAKPKFTKFAESRPFRVSSVGG